MTCFVENCSKSAYRRGMCNAHYCRWKRHGDPLSGRTGYREPTIWLLNVAFLYKAESCLLWPFGKTTKGYGMATWNGKQEYIQRIICTEVNGPSRNSDWEAAHSCGNKACANPKHIYWATGSENQMDRVLHGTSNRGEQNGQVKLSESAAKTIKSLANVFSARELAAMFDISRQAVNDIHAGRSWGWL